MKLYELDNEYLDFIAAVEDGTIPEDAIEDTLEMLNGDYKDKLDNTVCAIKNLTAEAKMIDEEIKALTARKKAKPSFEEGMASLEAMIAAMNEGGLSLEQSMKTYEEGMALAAQLEAMLAEHRRRIERIDPDTAEIETFEENENGVS